MAKNGGLQPMLVGKFEPNRVRFPVLIQPKYDGIRCIVKDGVGLSRTLKPIPNQAIQLFIEAYSRDLDGFDGELMVGDPRNEGSFRSTTSIMAQGGIPDFKYFVFDFWNRLYEGYFDRFKYLLHVTQSLPDYIRQRIELTPTHLIHTMDELIAKEAEFIADGFEGAIIRDPHGKYKYGRATPSEGWLIKVKRFVDAEAKIIGFEELTSNQNEQKEDNFGNLKRSSHKANKIPMDTLGAFIVKDDKERIFNIGTGRGLTLDLRKVIWDNRAEYLGRYVKFKYQEVGGYDAPRIPVWLGFRDERDMGTAE